MHSASLDFLRDGDALLDAIQPCGLGVWRWRLGTDRLEWTRNLEAVHGLPEGTFDGTLASFSNDIHPEDRDRVWKEIGKAVDAGQTYEVTYRTAPREGADTTWIRACGAKVALDGAAYLTGTCQNVTREVCGELELQKRLRHLSAVSEFGSFALAETDFRKVLERAVDVAASIFEVPMTKILQFGDAADRLELKAGLGWKDGLVGAASVGIDAESQAGYTLRSGAPVIVRNLRCETRFSGPPLLVEHGVISGMSVVIAGRGRPFGVFGVHDTRRRDFDDVDASSLVSLANLVANAWRQNEDLKRQELLTLEIAHRSNNLLQIVSVIAKQTFGGTADPAAANASFQERLAGISRANRLISRDGWTSTRLQGVIEEVLSPYWEQVVLAGRDILLPPRLCFDLALVLHELATNSVKYGSLGLAGSAVSINWVVTPEEAGVHWLELEWSDPETRHSGALGTGFGRRLKSLLIQEKWGGTMTIETRGGYRFRLSVPLTWD